MTLDHIPRPPRLTMTLDRTPPELFWPDDYEFFVVGRPGGTFEVRKSRKSPDLTAGQVAYRLRLIADALDIGIQQ